MVQGNASMSIPGHSYTTQSASYHNYVPAQNTYPPSHPGTTEGVPIALGGRGYRACVTCSVHVNMFN